MNAWESSTSFIDNNWRKRWANDLRAFQGRHPQGSKYESASYQFRSKLFRPKTRSAIRRTEAAGVSAFFSSLDSVQVEPTCEQDDLSVLVAKAKREALSHYIQGDKMKWFQTVIGGLQDSQKIGVVASFNHWKFRARYTTMGENQQGGSDYESTTLADHPCVQLWPLEYVRFHPAASWIDPINDSPYLIRMIPMYAQDVLARVGHSDRYEIPFTGIDRRSLAGARVTEDTTQAVRQEGQTQSQVEEVPGLTDYDLVWVHENIFRTGDQHDMVFYTLGAKQRISEVVPIEKAYWTGERPMTLGFFVLESHQNHPVSVPRLGASLQKEVNDLANVRVDNLHLVTNKRYLVQRGTQVDIKSLTRNAPASVTMVNDVDKDVRELEFGGLDAAAYAEQDRLNLDHDELVGNFSQSSVSTNRQLNETVGGMNMMMSGAGQMTDYGLRCFSESWLEPTLRQVDKLIGKYESNPKVLRNVALALGVEATPEDVLRLLAEDANITIDVGVGASNPMFKLERFLLALERYIKACVDSGQRVALDHKEFASELWGLVGYKNPRFIQLPRNEQEGEAMAQLEAQVAEMAQALEQKYMEEKAKQEGENERVTMKAEADMMKTKLEIDGKIQIAQAETEADAQAEERKGALEIRVTEAKAQIEGRVKQAEGMRQERLERLKVGASVLQQKEQLGTTRKEGRETRSNAIRLERTRQQGAKELEGSRQEAASKEAKAGRNFEAKKAGFPAEPKEGPDSFERIAGSLEQQAENTDALLQTLTKAQEEENELRKAELAQRKELLAKADKLLTRRSASA